MKLAFTSLLCSSASQITLVCTKRQTTVPMEVQVGPARLNNGLASACTSYTSYRDSNTMEMAPHFLVCPGIRNAGNEGCRESPQWAEEKMRGGEGQIKRGKSNFQKESARPFRCSYTPTSATTCISQASLTVTRLTAVRTPHSASTAAVLGSARCL